MAISTLRVNRFIALLSFLACCLPMAAHADTNTPLFYQRTNISVQRYHVPPLPWQANGAPSTIPDLIFDVEMRDATSYYNQEGWFNLASPNQKNGVMLVFSTPSVSPVIHSEQYAPLDVLFIDKEGKIVQILPNIMLANLEQDIYPQSPVLAFLFLKGGACADLSINPGDEITYEIFKKPPVILNAPPVLQSPAATSSPAQATLPQPPVPVAQPVSAASFLQAPPKEGIHTK